MAITGTRYISPDPGNTQWGGTVAASGPYVLVGWNKTTANTGLWLYKRDYAGVLQPVLVQYTPTLHSPSWSGAYWGNRLGCWYNEDESRLEIIVGAPLDLSVGTWRGGVWFLDWPDSGSVAGDMVELGAIYGETDGERLGRSVAICAGRAVGVGEDDFVTAYSRSGATWSKDDRAAYAGVDDVSHRGDAAMWQIPDTTTVISAVGAPIYATTKGRIYVRESTAQGATWTDLVTLEGVSTEAIGRAIAIGHGAGAGSIVSNYNGASGSIGAKIWDMDPADHTAWTDRGVILSAANPGGGGPGDVTVEAAAMGYHIVAFGAQWYDTAVLTNTGAVNISQWAGSWPVGVAATVLLEPSTPIASEYSTHDDALRFVYQDGGFVRLVCGDKLWGSPATGAIIEYNGDLDWPYPPSPQPVSSIGIASGGGSGSGEGIEVIAREVIKVNFTGAVAVTDTLVDPDNYVLAPGIRVAEVFPGTEDTTNSVLLVLTPKATLGATYSLTIPSVGDIDEYEQDTDLSTALFTPDGTPIKQMTAAWSHHKTKVDSLRANLSQMYNTSVGSTIFHMLTALGMSDEEIGGDFNGQ